MGADRGGGACWPDAATRAASQTAIAAARRAGEIQMRHFRKGDLSAKRELHDIKTETDQQCEAVILATIRRRFPDHAVLTEESGFLPGKGDCLWIVDPLDGTVNFWHGLPFFGVSIGCFRRSPTTGHATAQMEEAGIAGDPLAGVVLLPCTGELFVAVHGQGALLNGAPIRVSGVQRTEEALMSMSFGKTSASMRHMTARLGDLLPRVRKVRTLGAAAAEMAYVAAGYLGGTLYEGIKIWDFAAARIILEEAGGRLEAEETAPGSWRVLAMAPGLQPSLRRILYGEADRGASSARAT